MIRLLVVEDSALMRKLLGTVFAAEGDFEVGFARDGVEALGMIAAFRPDVVTLDIHMPQMDGLTCLDRIMVEHPCPVVMVSSLTAEGAEETLTALDMGAVDFIAKPGGAISLNIEDLAPRLVEKVRIAATIRLRRSLRLAERIRLAAAPRPGTAVVAPPPRRVPTPVSTGLVLVGSSTGGPPALDALLSVLPADFPWPIVIAQHMPGSFTGPLARRLDRLCALTVSEVTAPVALAPGHVYVGKGDADVLITRRAGRLTVMAAPASREHLWHPSVDRLVRSALQHAPATSLTGILMTGMGNDGAVAMTALQGAGGRTIAEAEETAIVWGMPGELVRLGGAGQVLPLERIAAGLLELAA